MTDLDPKGLEAAIAAHNTRQDPTAYMTTVQDYGLQEKARQRVQMSAAIRAYIAASPTQPVEAEAVAWADVLRDVHIAASLYKSRHCDQPLYSAATVSALQARVRKLEGALQRQKANIEHWLDTGEAAGPEESKSIYDQICAALAEQEADNADRP